MTIAPDTGTSATDRRKLVAVVYADMVGYSRLIGLDDAETLERLRTLRRNLIDRSAAHVAVARKVRVHSGIEIRRDAHVLGITRADDGIDLLDPVSRVHVEERVAELEATTARKGNRCAIRF